MLEKVKRLEDELKNQAPLLLEKVKKLEDQIRNHTRQKYSCQLCLKSPEAFFMFDCGHLPFCEICSDFILAENNPKCSICNKIVSNKSRAYIEMLKFSEVKSDNGPKEIITPPPFGQFTAHGKILTET